MMVRRRAWIALAVKRLDTGCTVRGSNPDEGEIVSQSSSCTMGTGGKVVGAWLGVDHPPVPSVTEVKEKVDLYLLLHINSPPVPPWHVVG
jgi:hypothetical protein